MAGRIGGQPNAFAQRLFRALPERYDRLVDVLSLGQNRRWRREMVDHALADAPLLVLDVASGTAGVALQLAERSPARVVGVDLSSDMLRRGRRNVAAAGAASRVSLVLTRAEQLPFNDTTFDALTFTYLLRYVADPGATLVELARVVKPGGRVASLDFFVPPHPFWRWLWVGYTRLVLPLAGFVTGGRAWFGVGRFLGPNISGHYRRYPLGSLEKAWESAGFVNVGVRLMSLGGGIVMWGERADGAVVPGEEAQQQAIGTRGRAR